MLDDAVHAQRCLAQLRSKDKCIEKYIYLRQLKDADPNMFYRLCLANMAVSARFPRARALLVFVKLAVSRRVLCHNWCCARRSLRVIYVICGSRC